MDETRGAKTGLILSGNYIPDQDISTTPENFAIVENDQREAQIMTMATQVCADSLQLDSPEAALASTEIPYDDKEADDNPRMSALSLYLGQVGTFPLLTAPQEVELAKAIEAGVLAQEKLANDTFATQDKQDLETIAALGEKAHQQMIESNLRLVVSFAKRRYTRKAPLLDLIQDGNRGLMRAVQKFDYTKGYKFSTYATWWVRQAVEYGLGATYETISVPNQTAAALRAAKKYESQHFTEKDGPLPSDEKIAKAIKVSPKLLQLARTVEQRRMLSLQAPLGTDASSDSLGNTVADTTSQSPEHHALSSVFESPALAGLRNILDTRELQVIVRYFGLKTTENVTSAQTLRDISKALKLPKGEAGRIKENALEKLRTYEGKQRILSSLDGTIDEYYKNE